MNDTLKKILMGLLIALVLLITIRYIKMFPAIMKLFALGANILTFYWAYTVFKTKKEKDEL